MSVSVIALVFVVLMFALFAIGMPIGFAMGLVGFLGFAYIVNLKAALELVAVDFFTVLVNYGFTVIALFILMGQLSANAGFARRVYDAAYRFIGHIPGGVAAATVVGAVLFKCICGSTNATVATFTIVAVPEMDRYHYDRRLSCGTAATVGTLGCLVPPSVALIIYGTIAEQSIGKMFLAGVIPGLLIALSFFLTIIVWCRLDPSIGPKGEKSTWKHRLRAIPSVAPFILIFLIVVGGLMKGFFTPTEAGSVGTFAVLLLSLTERNLDLKAFIKSVLDSVRTACMVLVLIAGAVVFGHFFAVTKLPFVVAQFLTGLPLSRELIVVLIIFIYLIGGSIVDDIAFVILITPLFLPVIDKLGYDPIWFGIIVMATLMIGTVIPPIAVCVFLVSSITKVPSSIVYRGVYPYLIGLTICVALFLLFPQISLWLPNLLMK
jgi:tripartite ATP-independent transporter DctM subunit